jgi:hypothetical protein
LNGVKGWLGVLCFLLTIFSPLYAIGQAGRSWEAGEPYFAAFPGLRAAVALEVFLTICLAVYSVGAGAALWLRQPTAVKTVEAYLRTVMIFAVTCPIVVIGVANLPAAATEAMVEQAVIGGFLAILNAALWLMYLRKSKRVQATFY